MIHGKIQLEKFHANVLHAETVDKRSVKVLEVTDLDSELVLQLSLRPEDFDAFADMIYAAKNKLTIVTASPPVPFQPDDGVSGGIEGNDGAH